MQGLRDAVRHAVSQQQIEQDAERAAVMEQVEQASEDRRVELERC